MKNTCIDSFIVCGPSVRTKTSDEFNPTTACIPKLWERFYSSHSSDQLSSGPLFGVYSNYESLHTGHYTVTAGIAIEQTENNRKFPIMTIAAGQYLVFESPSNDPKDIVTTWQNIWSYFEVSKTHHRNYLTDFEVYAKTEVVEIYIGILT